MPRLIIQGSDPRAGMVRADVDGYDRNGTICAPPALTLRVRKFIDVSRIGDGCAWGQRSRGASDVSTEALVDEVDGVPVDELSPEHYVYEEKHGRLVGWLKRERAYAKIAHRYDTIPYFSIAGYWHEVTDCDDVALAIVERWDGRYLPSYPRCPDCGGAVKWAEARPEFDLPVQWAEADQGPGSRKCTECESRFVDTRYDHIFEGWRMPCPHCDGRGHVPRSVAGIEDDES